MRRSIRARSALRGHGLSRRDLLKAMAAGVAGMALGSCGEKSELPYVPPPPKGRHPNVLFLFADQHQAACAGYENHPDVLTPHLDALAQSGTVFDRAYCSSGVCMASRWSLMTATHPRRSGVLDNLNLQSLQTTVMKRAFPLPSQFHRAGYRTIAYGRRHLPWRADDGWMLRKGLNRWESQDGGYQSWIAEHGLAEEHKSDSAIERGRKRETLLATRPASVPEDKTTSAYVANGIIEEIRAQAASDRPMFLWGSFLHPHQPYTPQARFSALYDATRWGAGRAQGDAIARPSSFDAAIESLPPLLQAWRRGENPGWRLDLAHADEQVFRTYIASYYALVSEVDHHVGRILAALREEGLLENTVVVYSSDHGEFAGRHGMVEKCARGHNVYEETLRVPMIVSWPGTVRSGARRSELAEMSSLYPSLLDLAGIRPRAEDEFDYPSLLQLLADAAPAPRPYVISENWSQATVITPDHKLGIWLDPTAHAPDRDFRAFGDMLFDRATDADEMQNVIGKPEFAETERALREDYAAFERAIPSTGRDEMAEYAS